MVVEFLALALWLVLAGSGVALAPCAVTAPAAGLAALASVAGAVACILFIALGGPLWAGWTLFGLSVLGTIGAALAAASLLDERNLTGSRTEEIGAGALGLQLPLFATAVFASLLVALALDTVS